MKTKIAYYLIEMEEQNNENAKGQRPQASLATKCNKQTNPTSTKSLRTRASSQEPLFTESTHCYVTSLSAVV